MGALGTVGQFAMASALHRAPAARIGTIEYTSIIWATVIGIFFFAEWPEWTSYAGACAHYHGLDAAPFAAEKGRSTARNRCYVIKIAFPDRTGS